MQCLPDKNCICFVFILVMALWYELFWISFSNIAMFQMSFIIIENIHSHNDHGLNLFSHKYSFGSKLRFIDFHSKSNWMCQLISLLLASSFHLFSIRLVFAQYSIHQYYSLHIHSILVGASGFPLLMPNLWHWKCIYHRIQISTKLMIKLELRSYT